MVASGIMLIVTAPLFATVALAQRLEGVPVLWRSPRVGRGGQPFDLLSFRTMRDLPTDNVDARLTRTGRVLRNYSLDHLPTLINVVRGDMAFVGPRPTETDRVDLDDPRWRRLLTVRPGLVSSAIVCLASTYPAASAERRLAYEVAYVDSASVTGDLRLLGQALLSLVRSRGNIKARGRPTRHGRRV
jgi:lipopolysaccharide/colanic/teichoic acid biosynthesis glycosyltransferase